MTTLGPVALSKTCVKGSTRKACRGSKFKVLGFVVSSTVCNCSYVLIDVLLDRLVNVALHTVHCMPRCTQPRYRATKSRACIAVYAP